jgi:hypothetical protein
VAVVREGDKGAGLEKLGGRSHCSWWRAHPQGRYHETLCRGKSCDVFEIYGSYTIHAQPTQTYTSRI